MRLTLGLLILAGFNALASSSYSQNARVTVEMKDALVKEVLLEIEENSEFFFVYNNQLVDVERKVDVQAKEQKIVDILDQVFDQDDVDYILMDKQIILSPSSMNPQVVNTQQQQEVRLQGVVTDSNGEVIPGVNVFEKSNPTNGVITDLDGKFDIQLSSSNATVTFSFIGYKKQDVAVDGKTVIDVTLIADTESIDEVIVTALGIKREEKSLGYAVSKVAGEELTKVQSTNFTSALSGRVAGVNITASGNMGGSTNAVIRGGSSITGSNQALYVIDGIPVSNASVNSGETNRGAGGYDFGNMASDINPNDIADISVLKGASATALYGSRGANGVILITTKKGSSKDRVGVSINSSVTFEKINKATLPTYQREYGGGGWDWDNGTSGSFDTQEINGTEYQLVDYGTDESWGPKFDPSVKVLHWDAFDPSDEANYLTPRSWKAAENGPEAFFETGVMYNNNVALDGAYDKGNFRASYTNMNQAGTVPNSELIRNTFQFNGTLELTDRLSTTVNGSWTNTKAKNRPGTGYDWKTARSFMASAGMWMQTNVDYERLANYARSDNGEQKTWNRQGWDNATPNYWDNPYWMVNKNYPEDERNRTIGSWQVDYKITDWLSVLGRATLDHYDFQIETRIANGSFAQSYYSKYMKIATERNYDAMLNFNKTFGDLNVTAMLGTSRRDNTNETLGVNTANGIEIDDLYTIHNSRSPEIGATDGKWGRRVNSVFGTASIGYKNQYYLDLSMRNDWSSTLPDANNSYFYPSVSGSWIVSEAVDASWLSFAKLRANWARVGNDAPFASTYDTYYNYGNFNGEDTFRYGRRSTKNNPELRPEMSDSWELGFDLKVLNNRLGLDFSYFNKVTKDQIIPGSVSVGTGYYSQYMNAGQRDVWGYEMDMFAVPVRTNNFNWTMNITFSQYEDEIKSLAPGIDSHVLNSNHVAVAARVGQPYPVLVGTDFVYDENGNKMVDEDGFYMQSDDNQILGKVAPDWRAGINNSFQYKAWSLSALIDIKQGGSLFSLTDYWGTQTGILENTVGLNDLGNPKRDPLTDDNTSGGVIVAGVKADGTPNDMRVTIKDAADSGNNPEAASVFDASYVKLREVSLSYSVPQAFCSKLRLSNLSLGVSGRNLAILHRNIDHIDPELTYGSGNVQGLDIGTMPTSRTFAFNLKIGF
ncbi:SusC/RagA family TonB-linked outer membrane protein [Carboxylicivirga sp. N1Y90]|uniref:SusC/RagA family TonB-linked outer membrane protein n=1 Tax=Carboxylicivirga fragile TaxID=3417571 RepID=UPI003D341372|nr:SusC/RagA family TonB-linked outer membrane protein [Marinilabiliaceae bacterium N1Y90]